MENPVPQRMRALMRIHLEPKNEYVDLWKANNFDKYSEKIEELFLKIGYAPELTVRKDKGNFLLDGRVKEIVDQIPDSYRPNEVKNLLMLCKTAEGQANFIVSAINPNVLHVRFHAEVYSKIQQACEEFYENAYIDPTLKSSNPESGLSAWSLTMGKVFHKKRKILDIRPGLNIRQKIEVLEKGQNKPTMMGIIIDSAYDEVKRNHPGEVYLLWFTGVMTVALFISTPFFSGPIADALQTMQVKFDYAYIEGALERAFSAFLVSFIITAVSISVQMKKLPEKKHIRWGDDLEEEQ